MEKFAVSKKPEVIEYIVDPSTELQLLAVCQNPETLSLLPDPPKEVVEAAKESRKIIHAITQS